jgi:hypothetical protein
MLDLAEKHYRNKSFVITLLQSVIMMLVVMISVHLLLRSFGVDFTSIQSFYCFGVYAAFQTVPIQGIAGVGTQAAWWTIALNAAGYQGIEGIAIGFMLYGTFYFFVAFMGLSSLLLWIMRRGNMEPA